MNYIKGLKQHHSRVPPVSLQVHAKAYAGGGGCPTWSYLILDAFWYVCCSHLLNKLTYTPTVWIFMAKIVIEYSIAVVNITTSRIKPDWPVTEWQGLFRSIELCRNRSCPGLRPFRPLLQAVIFWGSNYDFGDWESVACITALIACCWAALVKIKTSLKALKSEEKIIKETNRRTNRRSDL